MGRVVIATTLLHRTRPQNLIRAEQNDTLLLQIVCCLRPVSSFGEAQRWKTKHVTLLQGCGARWKEQTGVSVATGGPWNQNVIPEKILKWTASIHEFQTSQFK